jgi:putative ABC transport system substrate-binding protein
MRRRELMLLGGMMVAARGLRAEQKAMPVIGFLSGGSPEPYAMLVAAFRQGLSETGYVEGQNMAIEYHWAKDRYDRLPALAAELVGRQVDVISAPNLPSALAAKSATTTTPIVFLSGGDPIEHGLVANLARPGGNLTGISSLTIELTQKRVELLCELVPQARVIALLVNPTNPTAERVVREVLEAANIKSVQLRVLRAGTETEIRAAFSTVAQLRAGALVVVPDPLFYAGREQLVALAAEHAVPVIYPWRDFVSAGGLISYGPSLIDGFLRVGTYTGKILRGTKPADLPVEQSALFELVVNLNTANALGLTVPPSILARADEVIE